MRNWVLQNDPEVCLSLNAKFRLTESSSAGNILEWYVVIEETVIRLTN
jgi:hypothetical protein